ncbi:hypothetical protein QBC44DRAFT_322191, partial [Cladorrhinum sp. PSN332]
MTLFLGLLFFLGAESAFHLARSLARGMAWHWRAEGGYTSQIELGSKMERKGRKWNNKEGGGRPKKELGAGVV